MMTRNNYFVISFLYLLFVIAILAFIYFTGNEYGWMKEIDPTIKVPEDANQGIKKFIFGIPVMLLLFFIVFYSYKTMNRTYTYISIMLFFCTAILFFWSYNNT